MKIFFKRFVKRNILFRAVRRLSGRQRSGAGEGLGPSALDSAAASGEGGEGPGCFDPLVSVLGSEVLPRTLSDTAHLSILNCPAAENGRVTKVTCRLGGVPPGNGKDWQLRIYEQTGPHKFVLKRSCGLSVNPNLSSEQTVVLKAPVPIQKGQFVGLTNRSGRLAVTYNRGWSSRRNRLHSDSWDVWYQEHQPDPNVGSRTGGLLLWNGSVGWYATMEEDQPEPEMVRRPSSMALDISGLFEDEALSDVVFLVGPEEVRVHAHKVILKARSRYFAALLVGGFAESRQLGGGGETEVRIPDVSSESFTRVLEYLYTDGVTNVHEGIAAELLQAASRYCLDGLLACCEILIKDLVRVANVADVYGVAMECNADQLVAYCKYYARKHHDHLATQVSEDSAPSILELARESGLAKLQRKCEHVLKNHPLHGGLRTAVLTPLKKDPGARRAEAARERASRNFFFEHDGKGPSPVGERGSAQRKKVNWDGWGEEYAESVDDSNDEEGNRPGAFSARRPHARYHQRGQKEEVEHCKAGEGPVPSPMAPQGWSRTSNKLPALKDRLLPSSRRGRLKTCRDEGVDPTSAQAGAAPSPPEGRKRREPSPRETKARELRPDGGGFNKCGEGSSDEEEAFVGKRERVHSG